MKTYVNSATGTRVSKTVINKNVTGGDKYVTTYYFRDLAEGVYTTQYRLLDTRLGRWMSVDPLWTICG